MASTPVKQTNVLSRELDETTTPPNPDIVPGDSVSQVGSSASRAPSSASAARSQARKDRFAGIAIPSFRFGTAAVSPGNPPTPTPTRVSRPSISSSLSAELPQDDTADHDTDAPASPSRSIQEISPPRPRSNTSQRTRAAGAWQRAKGQRVYRLENQRPAVINSTGSGNAAPSGGNAGEGSSGQGSRRAPRGNGASNATASGAASSGETNADRNAGQTGGDPSPPDDDAPSSGGDEDDDDDDDDDAGDSGRRGGRRGGRGRTRGAKRPMTSRSARKARGEPGALRNTRWCMNCLRTAVKMAKQDPATRRQQCTGVEIDCRESGNASGKCWQCNSRNDDCRPLMPLMIGDRDDLLALRHYIRGVYTSNGIGTEVLRQLELLEVDLHDRFDHCEQMMRRHFQVTGALKTTVEARNLLNQIVSLRVSELQRLYPIAPGMDETARKHALGMQVTRLTEHDPAYTAWQSGLSIFKDKVKEVLDTLGEGNGTAWEDNFPVDIDPN